ncbi:MAG: DUF4167 domain-containing protein [Hyphomicrobiales bacterium]|nr:DUF4167 domain-containing protein [Hyphomicrobiales bacterium]
MRNGQNKRMRGRNRKGGGGGHHHHHQNPLSRMYESNGPDVKIRGTASHVAEKYLQLARDAQSSGDPVAAENYYQHAEHYFRLIAAAQEQFRQSQPYYQQQPQGQPSAGGNGPDDGYDDGDDQPQIGEPFAPREQQPVYPQQNQQQQQHNPYSQHHQYNQQNNHNQQNNQRPQHMQPESEQDVDRLPSFITGGQSQQPQQGQSQGGNGSDGSNGYDGSDRFQRHRRRRHRGPRDHVQGDHTLRGDNDAAMPPGGPQED